MPADPTGRSPLLRLPRMRGADAPGLGRTNQQVRRNVCRLRRLLTPKISRRRQPTEALMITEECHREELQAFATRRLADEGPTHYSPRGGSPRLSRSFYSRGCPVQARLGGLPQLSASVTSPPACQCTIPVLGCSFVITSEVPKMWLARAYRGARFIQ
jgi:hypothetical protein